MAELRRARAHVLARLQHLNDRPGAVLTVACYLLCLQVTQLIVLSLIEYG